MVNFSLINNSFYKASLLEKATGTEEIENPVSHYIQKLTKGLFGVNPGVKTNLNIKTVTQKNCFPGLNLIDVLSFYAAPVWKNIFFGTFT